MPDWHHAPIHRLTELGAYCVTGATYLKQRFFHTRKRLDLLQEIFFETAKRFTWWLQVWSLFPNHYHFVAYNDTNPDTLAEFINELHSASGRELNAYDGESGRQVWFQYWDTRLTTAGSYLASSLCPGERCPSRGGPDRDGLSLVLRQMVRTERQSSVRKGGR